MKRYKKFHSHFFSIMEEADKSFQKKNKLILTIQIATVSILTLLMFQMILN